MKVVFKLLFNMAKFTAAIIASMAGSAVAFAPVSTSVRSTTAVSEFANGLVGGEGPEPMPFNAGAKTSKNFDPAGFSEVSRYLLSGESFTVYYH